MRLVHILRWLVATTPLLWPKKVSFVAIRNTHGRVVLREELIARAGVYKHLREELIPARGVDSSRKCIQTLHCYWHEGYRADIKVTARQALTASLWQSKTA